MSNNKDEEIAVKLKERAQRLLAQFSTFSLTSKYEDAVICFETSAEIYEMSFKWFEAAHCFMNSASVRKKLHRPTQAAATYTRAARNYERSKKAEREAITCYQEAIELYCCGGRFKLAAMRAERVAELFVMLGELNNAKSYYYQAKEYYESGEDIVSCMRSSESYARVLATLEDYDKAKAEFDDLIKRLLSDEISRFHAKRIVVHSVICSLFLNDVAEIKRVNRQARNSDCTFPFSKEDNFTKAISEAMANRDLNEFIDLVYSFDYIRELDDWELDMFERLFNLLTNWQKEREEEELRAKEAEKEKLIEQKELVQRKRRERLRKLGARGVI